MSIIILTCRRCNHEWPTKQNRDREISEQIRVCPKCKSPYWDREKVQKVRRSKDIEKQPDYEEQIAALKERIKELEAANYQMAMDRAASERKVIILTEGHEWGFCSECERIKKLESLIDGATEIIEIWEAVTPGQVEWKRHWLQEAKQALKGEEMTQRYAWDDEEKAIITNPEGDLVLYTDHLAEVAQWKRVIVTHVDVIAEKDKEIHALKMEMNRMVRY